MCLNSLENAWLHKEARCIRTASVNEKKPQEPDFHQRIATEPVNKVDTFLRRIMAEY